VLQVKFLSGNSLQKAVWQDTISYTSRDSAGRANQYTLVARSFLVPFIVDVHIGLISIPHTQHRS
jgi:hypothetical protein